MLFNGLGVAPDPSTLLASDILNDLVKNFRDHKRVVFLVGLVARVAFVR
jgi:hypothetical protein